jgi:murein DD-endopeptidase MepM/ murein hydrolase activator NlpD
MKVAGMPAVPVPGGIESLRGRNDPEAVRAAAREMESVFAYEMVKAMRATAGGSATGEGFGGEVYGTLFDMELAKVLASKGLGLQEILLKGFGRAENTQKNDTNQMLTRSIDAPAESAAPPAAAPAISGPHTHEPLEESAAPPAAAPADAGRAKAPPAEAVFPIREGGRVSSGFGIRKDPFTGKGKFHHGVDIAAAEGTAVHPVKEGEVTFSGYQKGYGNVVVVDHGDGFVTKYAHNRANRVSTGDRVNPDTVIAEVGSTGRSTGPHLHFEVRYGGEKVRPETVFAGGAKGYG